MGGSSTATSTNRCWIWRWPCRGARPSVHDLDVAALQARRVVTERHCFGCTAGQGSSCGGATA
ncbi:MAG: DUF3641 domain-containing protein [bacterium]